MSPNNILNYWTRDYISHFTKHIKFERRKYMRYMYPDTITGKDARLNSDKLFFERKRVGKIYE